MASVDSGPQGPDAEQESVDSSPEGPDAEQESVDSSPEGPDAEQESVDSSPEGPDAEQENVDSSPEEPDAEQESVDSSPEEPDAEQENVDSSPEGPDAEQENVDSSPEEPDAEQESVDSSPEEPDAEQENVNSSPEGPDAEQESVNFKDLGVVDVLCEACQQLKWGTPTRIQREAIPLALQGKDVIGLAETGSGKTGAFAIPILQDLLEHPQRYFALVLTPTRELAFQISEQFEALGASIGVKCAVIVGGMDMMPQALMLAKKPHILIATPGRLVDHLENTKGFNLRALKYLVMDEADRILNMDFEVEIDKILRVIPRERHTFLFSATMTKKVQKLQRASLQDPVKVEVSTKYQTVDKLQQYYIFIPVKFKDVYLVHILNEMAGNSFMVFCATCNNTMRTALLLRNLGFMAVPLHGQMSQNKRLGALTKFRAKNRSILISTDVASRGLDIPHVDVVINFDIPTHSKDYIHRVGRTARAGRSGKSITFVTQYDVELYQRIEHLIDKQLPLYKTEEDEVMSLQERVSEAQRMARMELKDMEEKKQWKGKRKKSGGDDDDTEEAQGVRKRLKGRNKKRRK